VTKGGARTNNDSTRDGNNAFNNLHSGRLGLLHLDRDELDCCSMSSIRPFQANLAPVNFLARFLDLVDFSTAVVDADCLQLKLV